MMKYVPFLKFVLCSHIFSFFFVFSSYSPSPAFFQQVKKAAILNTATPKQVHKLHQLETKRSQSPRSGTGVMSSRNRHKTNSMSAAFKHNIQKATVLKVAPQKLIQKVHQQQQIVPEQKKIQQAKAVAPHVTLAPQKQMQKAQEVKREAERQVEPTDTVSVAPCVHVFDYITRCYDNPKQYAERQSQFTRNVTQAMAQFEAGYKEIRSAKYVLTDQAYTILNDLELDSTQFSQQTSTNWQLAKHAEITFLANEFGSIYEKHYHLKPFVYAMYGFVDAARESNTEGNVQGTAQITDFCWGMIKSGYKYAQAAGTGLVEGGVNGVSSVIHMLCTPVNTLQQCGTSLVFLGSIVTQAISCADAFDASLVHQFAGIESNRAEEELVHLQKTLDAIKGGLYNAYQKHANKSGPEKIRLLTSFGTEIAVSGKTFGLLARGAGALYGQAAEQLGKIAEVLRKEATIEHAALAAGNIELKLALETTNQLAGKMADSAEKAVKTGIKLAENNVPMLKKIPIENMLESIKQYGDTCRKLGLELPTKGFLKHVRESHMPGGAKAIIGKKSIFQEGVDFVASAFEAWEKGKVIEPGVKIYDFGYPIGINAKGQLTSQAKVVLNGTLTGFRTTYPI